MGDRRAAAHRHGTALVVLALLAGAQGGCTTETGWETENFACWPTDESEYSPDCVDGNICHQGLFRCVNSTAYSSLNSRTDVPKVFHETAWKIDQYEVSIAHYTRCIIDGVCSLAVCPAQNPALPLAPGPTVDHPVACVTWSQAQAYCGWAGGRLPTEEEWLRAAGMWDHAQTWPWGNDPPTCSVAWFDIGTGPGCGNQFTQPIGLTSPSHGGIYDIYGNVSEWVATSEPGSQLRKNYGGAFDTPAQDLNKAFELDGATHSPSVGMRCIYD